MTATDQLENERQRILEMKPGRELDALVETVVMKRFASTGEHGDWTYPAPRSRNVAASWEVVEKLRDDYNTQIDIFVEDSSYIVFWENKWVESESIAEAICKAALLAVMAR